VQQRPVDTRFIRNFLEARPIATLSGEHPERGVENPRLGIQVIGSRRDL
jgi:hypothetical protein